MRVYRWGIFFVCLFSFNSFASVLNELPKNEKIRLFSIHGSNTIGAEMAPNLLKQWFSSQKLSNIQRVDTGVENEQIIRAYQPKLRSEEHTSELQSRPHLVCRLLLEKKKKKKTTN